MRLTNCVNCGAPLHGNKCEYCGTEYTADDGITAKFADGSSFGTLEIGSAKYECYIGSMEAHQLYVGAGRDMNGRLVRSPMALKHKFVLIER